MKKRILSAILALLMLVTSLPVVTLISFAQGESDVAEQETTQKTYNAFYAKRTVSLLTLTFSTQRQAVTPRS